MRLLNVLWVFILITMLLTGCTIPHPPCDLAAITYPAAERLSPPAATSLQLGVIDASRIYAFDLPAPLKQSRAQLAVIDDVRWGFIEPEPPLAGQHDYAWDAEDVALDTRVEAYQAAGFEPVIVLRAWNIWARVRGPQGGQAAQVASTPPRSEYLADYGAWVGAVVERYDGDGLRDFHGLVDGDGDGQPDPVRYYQIETEMATGVWWQGNEAETAVPDYLQLLRTAATAARAAFPQTRILLAGIPGLDLLDRFPSSESLTDVVNNINPAVCGAIDAFDQALAARDAFDIITVHSLADYTGLATLAAWTAALSEEPVEVWITGATSAPALVGDPQSLRVNPLYPAVGEVLWAALRQPADPQHGAVERWYRAEQARLSFKKWVYAAWSGFSVLIVGLEQDRPTLENEVLGQRDLAFQGLLDPAGGAGPPAPRPAIFALALAQAQLGGYTAVERLPGLAAGIEAFRFMVEGVPVYVAWYDDGKNQGPTDPPAAAAFDLAVRGPQITVLTAPILPEQSGPIIDLLTPSAGRITLTLTETPVVLRGDWTPLYLPRLAQP